MATEKWIGGSGQGLTYGTAFNTTNLNSMANGSAVLSSIADIANGTALDLFADVSFSLGSVTTTGAPYVGIYLYPLNQDGTTYGDGQFPTPGTPVAAAPAITYLAGNIIHPVATGVVEGTLRGIILPPGSFRFVLYNQLGVTLAASANTVQYRTYNRSLI